MTNAPDVFRKELDKRLTTMQPIDAYAVPHKGWIAEIREALGMTAIQLARRVGVTPQTLSRLEKSEARQTIRLETLARVAPALGCRLVYALVPEESLEAYVDAQARCKARQHFSHVTQTMLLENQSVGDRVDDEQMEQFITELKQRPKRLWS